jgi:C4-type Zn-finger protein
MAKMKMNRKLVCPLCNSTMSRIYQRISENGHRCFVGIGWRCKNPYCNYVTQDCNMEEEKS